MHRFFVRPGTYAADRLAIPDEIRHQLRDVLRARPGPGILLLDGSGTQAHCRVVDDGALEVVERGAASGEPRHRSAVPCRRFTRRFRCAACSDRSASSSTSGSVAIISPPFRSEQVALAAVVLSAAGEFA